MPADSSRPHGKSSWPASDPRSPHARLAIATEFRVGSPAYIQGSQQKWTLPSCRQYIYRLFQEHLGASRIVILKSRFLGGVSVHQFHEIWCQVLVAIPVSALRVRFGRCSLVATDLLVVRGRVDAGGSSEVWTRASSNSAVGPGVAVPFASASRPSAQAPLYGEELSRRAPKNWFCGT